MGFSQTEINKLVGRQEIAKKKISVGLYLDEEDFKRAMDIADELQKETGCICRKSRIVGLALKVLIKTYDNRK